MLNLKTIAAATALASVIAFAPAQAQFVGGPSNVTTVKNLLDSGKDDQLATLEGYIVQQVKLIRKPRCALTANSNATSWKRTRLTSTTSPSCANLLTADASRRTGECRN